MTKATTTVRAEGTDRERLQARVDEVRRRASAIPAEIASSKAQYKNALGDDDDAAKRFQLKIRDLEMELERRDGELQKLESRWPAIERAERESALPGLLERRAKLFRDHSSRAPKAPAAVEKAIVELNQLRFLEAEIQSLDNEILSCAASAELPAPKLAEVSPTYIDLNEVDWVPILRQVAGGGFFSR